MVFLARSCVCGLSYHRKIDDENVFCEKCQCRWIKHDLGWEKVTIKQNMKLLSKEQLQNLTTPRLLAYKNKLMQVPEASYLENTSPPKFSKSDPQWQETYTVLKEVLSTREHVE